MFDSFRTKKADVLSHWYALVPSFQTSAQEFYAEIEKELQARQVPGLELSRVEFAEGGLLSDKRVYLRMIRERLTFDVCAAPFGTSYFFSCRFAVIPPTVRPWEVLVFLFGMFILFSLAVQIIGFFLGPFLLLLALIFCVWLMRNAIGLGLRDLDTTLIRTPVIGPIYERYLRKETYYRFDTRIMYHDTVSEIVKQKVEDVTAAKGVKLLRTNEHSPFMAELYKKKDVRLDEKQAGK